jgi:hypothetical protein
MKNPLGVMWIRDFRTKVVLVEVMVPWALHTYRNLLQTRIKMLVRMWENRIPLYAAGGNVN